MKMKLFSLMLWLFSTAAVFAQSSERWIPEVFDKLKIGMPWNEAVAVLPNATYYGGLLAGLDDNHPKSTKPEDHPGHDLKFKLANQGMMNVFFADNKLTSFRFSYPIKDVAVAAEMQRDLESRFGAPKSTAFDKQTQVQFYKWDAPDLTCYLLVPTPESARGAALTVNVSSKEVAAKTEKSLTLTPYTKPAASTSTPRPSATTAPTTAAEKTGTTGFPVVPVVILLAVIAGAAVFFFRRKSP